MEKEELLNMLHENQKNTLRVKKIEMLKGTETGVRKWMKNCLRYA